MRVLVAPQEFKGTLAAEEAADAIAAGIARARPGWEIDRLPMSDGGPGFLDALRRAVRNDTHAEVVHDALGRPVLGRYLTLRGRSMAVVEAAQANGLMHMATDERDAMRADTFGVGELLLAAVRHRAATLLVGVGGSATTDGGAGMARALGARLLDRQGAAIPTGGGGLAKLDRIAWKVPEAFASIDVVVATDVVNPLTGPNGAAQVFGPQKGATPEQCVALDAGLARFAAVVRRDLGVDVERVPGAGAAGGLAGGLIAFLGARVASGFDVVAEAANLRARLRDADIVVTGEGSFDSQSRQGKVTGRILELAVEDGKPCAVFAGRAPGGGARTLDEVETDGARRMSQAATALEALAARWASEQP
ncbi:MAG: glycerate kinase [Dehalococcoidia bacterium]|nr:glycerate kinase [Dehalococcoidia bacterium]